MRPPILTSRLLLRDLTESDAPLLFDLDSDPQVLRYVGPRLANDVAAVAERIRTVQIPQQNHPWHGTRIVLDRFTNDFLGWVFIRPAPASRSAAAFGWTNHSEVEIGYRYRRSAWGRGIATEAAMPLMELALADAATSAIVACAHSNNTGSLRVLAKLGLKPVSQVILPDATEPTFKLARPKIGTTGPTNGHR